MFKRLLIIFLAALLACGPITAHAATIARLKDAEISNGNAINADDLDAEFNQLVNESNSKETRITNLESGDMSISGAKTFSGNITLSGTTNSFGGTNTFSAHALFPQSSDPGSPSAGELWVNTSTNALKYRSGGTTYTVQTSTSAANPKGYRASAPPVYVSASTFTVASINDRNSTNDGDIQKSTSTTVDTSTTGLNGMAQSSALTGTVTVTGGAASVTGSSTTFLTDFVVGDVICVTGSQCRRITVVSNNTSMTVESNFSGAASSATYKRGGLAPSTQYNLYALTNGTTTGLILSTRNVASGDTLPSADLPSGYSSSTCQEAFSIFTDTSSNFLPFKVADGWPRAPKIIYMTASSDGFAATAGTTNVLNAGSSGSFATISNCTKYIPTTSRSAGFYFTNSSANTGIHLRTNSTLANQVASQSSGVVLEMPLDSNRTIDYKRFTGAGNLYIDVYSYTITEVP